MADFDLGDAMSNMYGGSLDDYGDKENYHPPVDEFDGPDERTTDTIDDLDDSGVRNTSFSMGGSVDTEAMDDQRFKQIKSRQQREGVPSRGTRSPQVSSGVPKRKAHSPSGYKVPNGTPSEQPAKQPVDSVSISGGSDDGSSDTSEHVSKRKLAGGFKMLLCIFLIFIFVVSDVFTNSVISNFGGAVNCRSPTPYGTVLQGIFLVIFYIIVVYLLEKKVI